MTVNKQILWRAPIMFFLCFNAYAGDARMLCHGDEEVLFSCDLENKMAAVCSSPGVTPTSGYIQYRFGTQNNIELVYPSQLMPPKGRFFFAHTGFGGGDGSDIRFRNGRYEYILFSKTVRTNFKPGESNDPQESAGILVRASGKSLKTRGCIDWDAVHGAGIDAMDVEEYSDAIP